MKSYLMIIAVAIGAVAVNAQTPEVKTAEQVYKNITALKGTPADQLVPAMNFMAAALGVECGTCHVQGKPEADDKGTKKTARAMIEMTAMINKNAFNGRQQVTCYSCHNGHERPTAIPPVLESDPPARTEPPAATAAAPAARPQGPTADDIIAKYVAGMGGEAAIKKITSRAGKGEIVAMGSKQSIDVITKVPNKRITITHSGNSDSMTAFDGTNGWMGNAGRPGRDMDAGGSSAAALDAEFAIALRIKELYPQIRRGRPETVNGVECEVLQANPNGNHPAIRLSFAKDTGLLMRMVRYADTPLGRNPTQVDYADYRDADGVKIPFRWTLSRTNGRFTIQLTDVKSNVPVEDSKFAKP
jgi:photosynthetic reaction center cytochrome c subunit